MFSINSFYSLSDLDSIGFGEIGENVFISKKTSIYGAENIKIGNNVRIDDFSYLNATTGSIVIGSYVHLSIGVLLFGAGHIIIKDFCGISSRSALYSDSSDFSGKKMAGPTIPNELTENDGRKKGIIMCKYTLLGTLSTILPGVCIGEGSAVGAHSLVLNDLDEWGIFVGVPVKKIKCREKSIIIIEKNIFRKDIEGR